jgi:hypothetical protein
LLAKECPTSLLRAHIDDASSADRLTGVLADWTALADGPLVDLCLFLEEMGAVAAPGPFLATTALYRPLAALAGYEPRSWGTVVSSEPLTLEAARADEILVVAGESGVARVTDHTITARPTIDTTRHTFTVDVRSTGDVVKVDAVALRDWQQRAAVALAAEMAGTARTLLTMSVEYAKQRVQFDKPIGSFQAIQHKLADMALSCERAWSAVYYAAMAHDAGDADRHRATHVAKAAAGEAATRAARDGIQVHGGIGYTWEHDLHLFLRRAYASEHLLGTTSWHHDQLGALLFSG